MLLNSCKLLISSPLKEIIFLRPCLLGIQIRSTLSMPSFVFTSKLVVNMLRALNNWHTLFCKTLSLTDTCTLYVFVHVVVLVGTLHLIVSLLFYLFGEIPFSVRVSNVSFKEFMSNGITCRLGKVW